MEKLPLILALRSSALLLSNKCVLSAIIGHQQKELIVRKIYSISLMALLLNTCAYAQSRCLEMIEQRVKNTHLNLSQCKLTAKDAPSIIAFLNTHPHVTSLNLHANSMGNSAKLFAKNTSLTTLDLSNNIIKSIDVTDFSNNTTLKSLDLSGNPLLADGILALAQNKSLLSLNVANSKVTLQGVVSLAKSNTLKTLNLAGNHLDNDSAFG